MWTSESWQEDKDERSPPQRLERTAVFLELRDDHFFR
jgi:hypothetical protein